MSTESPLVFAGHSDWVVSISELTTDESIITLSLDDTIRTWSLVDQRCTNIFQIAHGSAYDIAVLDSDSILMVTSHEVKLLSSSNGEQQDSCIFPNALSICVATSSTAAILCDTENALHRIEWNYGTLRKARVVHNAHRNRIKAIYAYGTKFATCSDDKTAKLWDASSLALVQTFEGNFDSVISVAYNEKYLVTGSLDREIRIYDVNSAVLLASAQDHSEEVNCVRILPSGSYCISSDHDSVLVHKLPSGEFKKKFDFSMGIQTMCLLRSGAIAIAGEEPNHVLMFDINEDELGPSYMEQAFVDVMHNPSLLSIQFIEKTIKSEHVHSASDLFCGHNIILLSIRAGVLSKNDLDRFNGNIWFLEENLYYPASKLTSENSKLLYSIFHHAEDIGIIRDGFKFRAEHENRVDSSLQFQSIRNSVTDLSIRLANAEHNLETVHENIRIIGDNIASLQKSVEVNAKNFQYLFESIERQQTYRKYASVAKVFLSLIPILGSAMGSAADAGTDIFLGLNAEELTESGIDFAKSKIDNLASVDVSSALVTYCALSKSRMRAMTPPTRQAILQAVEKSDFKNIDNLRSELLKMIQDVDDGSRKWMNELPEPVPAPSPVPPTENVEHERIARHQFNSFAQARNRSVLKIPEACEALNMTFRILKIDLYTTESQFMDTFVEVSEELDVDEDTFVAIFDALSPKLPTVDVASLVETYRKAFDDTHMAEMSIAYACQLLKVTFRNLKSDGVIAQDVEPFMKISPSNLRDFDKNGDAKFACDEFVSAALYIIHEISEFDATY